MFVIVNTMIRSKLGALGALTKRLLGNLYAQAAVVGVVLILPILAYVALSGRIIAPLNVMPGWAISDTRGEVVAPIPSDVNQQMLPFRQYTQESMRQGEVPLWNARSFAGDVFLANPINTALSPLNFLLFLVDIYTFQNIIVLFGLFLMAASTYLLIRQLSLSKYAGVVGAIAFTFAPFSVFWSIYGIISIPMAAIPLALFLYLRWRSSGLRVDRHLIGLVLVLGLVMYTGHIQVSLLAYGMVFLLVLFDLLVKSLKPRRLPYVIGAFGLAIIIALGQIIPTAVQAPASHRSSEVVSAPPKSWRDRLPELANIPTAYDLSQGPNLLGVSARRDLSVGQVPGILFIISFVLLIVAAIRRRAQTDNTILFFALAFILGAFWQWGDFPQTLLNSLSPTFRSLATDYFLPIALLSMAVLAAYGLDRLISFLFGKRRASDQRRKVDYLAIIPVLIVAAISGPQLILHITDNLPAVYYLLYYACIVVALIIFVAARSSRLSRQLFAITVLIVALMQGWALYRVTQPIVTETLLQSKNPALNYIDSKEKDTVFIVDYVGPQESILYDVGLLNGYDSLYSDSIQYRIKAINYPNETPPSYRNNSLVINTKVKPTLFKNLGIAYTINEAPVSGYAATAPSVYKADQPTPRVYFAAQVTSASEEGQLEALRTGDVGYHEVFIDGAYGAADPSSSVDYTFSANSVTLQTHSPDGGLVFIAQTYNPDWSAQLEDGSNIDILPAYYNFTAIDVPAGSHTITLRYSPKATMAGIAISATAIMGSGAFLALFWATRRYNRRKREITK